MIKIFNEKKGSIFVEELFLENTIRELMKTYFSKKGFIDVSIQVQKNSVEGLEIYFDKSTNFKKGEELSLSHELLFVLSNKFNIDNSKMIFIYENRN